MAKISIIVPVYNTEKYLRRCVMSILRQTFADFELILVDDGSPDGAGEQCDEWCLKDNRIHVIHQNNRGLSAARNAGIDYALFSTTCEKLLFIDSDDCIHPRMVEVLDSASENPEIKISLCEFHRFSSQVDDSYKYELIPKPEIITPKDLYLENSTLATISWAKLYHRSCFSDLRFPEGKIHEDQFLTYKILFQQNSLSIVRAPLYFYYINPEGITGGMWTPKRLDGIEAMDEQLIFFEKQNDIQLICVHVKSYLYMLRSQLQAIQKSMPANLDYESCKYEKIIRIKLRHLLSKYRRLHCVDLKSDKWVYEGAYPLLMSLYYLVRK